MNTEPAFLELSALEGDPGGNNFDILWGRRALGPELAGTGGTSWMGGWVPTNRKEMCGL